MTWLKIDDKITTHPKWLPLTIEAKSLWFHAAVWCAAHNNDGHVPGDAMPLIAFSASITPADLEPAAEQLVKARLWKRRAKRAGGGHEIVNWLDYQPSRQQVKERADADDLKAQKKRLHDWLHKKAVGKRVKAIIDARDGLWCRYCTAETVITPGDRRGPHRRTYDLIDPESVWDTTQRGATDDEMARLADMWAVACGWCNAIKADRTPGEAGLELLPPPRRGPHGFLPRSVLNRSGTVPEVGTGLVGSAQDGPVRDGQAAVDEPPPHTDEHAPPEVAE